MKRLPLLLGVLLFGLLTSCFNVHVTTYQDDMVKVIGYVPSVAGIPAVHADGGRTDLRIENRTYRNVRGLKSCYLDVPELNSILFVTNNPTRIHLVSRSTKKSIDIDGEKSSFGVWIGWTGEKYPEGVSCYVSEATQEGLTLVTLNGPTKPPTVEYLNLRTQKLEAKENNFKFEVRHQ